MDDPGAEVQSLVRLVVEVVEQVAENMRTLRDANGLPLRGESADSQAGERAHDLFHNRAGADAAELLTPSDLAPAVKCWGHVVDDRQWRALAQIAGKLGWTVDSDDLRRWWRAQP